MEQLPKDAKYAKDMNTRFTAETRRSLSRTNAIITKSYNSSRENEVVQRAHWIGSRKFDPWNLFWFFAIVMVFFAPFASLR